MVSPITFINIEDKIASGLSPDGAQLVLNAYQYVLKVYDDKKMASGESVIEFAQTVCSVLVTLNTDAETRAAGLLIPLPQVDPQSWEKIETLFGSEIVGLVDNTHRLLKLKEVTSELLDNTSSGKNATQYHKDQIEALRKMVLAMASDIRVVLLRLAARVAGLRYIAETKKFDELSKRYARETLDLYAPLANRLGIWQMKWELEDLSFRFLEPETYKTIAKMLEEKRTEREDFVLHAIERVKSALKEAGIRAEVSGRPKHIYSIYNKMRGKSLEFTQMHDVRALRVIVTDIKTCFTVLDLIHKMWEPVLEEFDDYISHPKPNGYQSLHTIVTAEDGLSLEVQIRTEEMHRFAEYGVASHWRYKESGTSDFTAQQYDEKISWLRQLLSWKAEVTDTVAEQEEAHSMWVKKIKSTVLDDRIYVLTPQARLIDLPKGATPIDFAYQVHTNVGHRCRGARVDGVMVPLNTPLKSGQTVEIITAKGVDVGPSRDWLGGSFAVSPRTFAKIRAWFNAIDHEEITTSGRTIVEKVLQREGKTAVNLEDLAHKLGFSKTDEFYFAVGKDKINARAIEQALHENSAQKEKQNDEELVFPKKSRASSIIRGAKSGVLVVGAEGLMTQMARCCKPAPPDPIIGFVTRGKGVSIHRPECKNFLEMQKKSPARVIQTDWGTNDKDTLYPVDVFVIARDRKGLLRDISDIFMKEQLNVIGVNTQSHKGQARMSFTVEISSTDTLNKAISSIQEVNGVLSVKRH